MKIRIIDAHQVSRMRENGAVLVNVLPQEYFEAGHIKGSRNICVYERGFLEQVRNITSDPLREIVVYGKNKNFHASELAYVKLDRAGYKSVYDFRGGIEEWQKEGFEIEGNMHFPEELVPPGSYTVDPDKSLIEWNAGNIFIRHEGTIKIQLGEVLVGEGSHIIGGRFIFDIESLVATDMEEKHNHMLAGYLKSIDFLHVKKFPAAEFRMLKAHPIFGAKYGAPNHAVQGELTVRDITHPISFEAQVETLEAGMIFVQARFSLNRVLWKLNYFLGIFWGLWEDRVYFRVKLVAEKKS